MYKKGKAEKKNEMNPKRKRKETPGPARMAPCQEDKECAVRLEDER